MTTRLLKINLRAKTKENARQLLEDLLGGEVLNDRGSDTIGEFEGCTFKVADVMFDVVVPSGDDTPLGRVIDKRGEGIDSICFSVESLAETKNRLSSKGVEFARESEFKGNKIGFVHPRDACGVGLEFIEGGLGDVRA